MPEPVFFQHFQVDQNPDGGLRELGRGAMGITYKAFDTNLQCPVALKIINAILTDNENARERFLREARAAARLRHPNVATVLHLGKDEQSFFYAMEFIDGETLEAYVARRGPLAPVLALEVVQQVARALGAAQNEGLVHRDIKPANLMLVHHQGEADDEGIHVKVIDFGLAKFIDKGKADSLNLTMGGGFVGSPYFASPEQVDEGEIDTRSDIYSLGATLWFLLAGEAPFTGSLGQVLAQHLQRPPPYEKLEAKGLPAPVMVLLRRLLAKAPEDRPSDPAALRREVTACLRSLGAVTGSSSGTVPAGDGLLAGQYLVPGSRSDLDRKGSFDKVLPSSGESRVIPEVPPPLPPPIPPPPTSSTLRKSCLVMAALVAVLILGGIAIAISERGRQGKPEVTRATPHDTSTEDPEDSPDTPSPAEIPDHHEMDTPAPPIQYSSRPPATDNTPAPAYPPPGSQGRVLPTLPNGVRAIASYRARLSERDHRSSTGTRLTLVPDILRQDRANFYRSPRDRDPEDEGDPLFANTQQRALRFNDAPFRGNVRDVIVNGTPYVQVDIYPVGFYVTVLSP